MPHRDAVRDGDGAELQRVAAAAVDAFLGALGEPVEGQVARGDLVPGRGDADLRLLPVLVAHPDGPQHATRGGCFDPVGDDPAPRLHVDVRHALSLGRIGIPAAHVHASACCDGQTGGSARPVRRTARVARASCFRTSVRAAGSATRKPASVSPSPTFTPTSPSPSTRKASSSVTSSPAKNTASDPRSVAQPGDRVALRHVPHGELEDVLAAALEHVGVGLVRAPHCAAAFTSAATSALTRRVCTPCPAGLCSMTTPGEPLADRVERGTDPGDPLLLVVGQGGLVVAVDPPLDTVRADERHVVGRLRHRGEAVERPPGDEDDLGALRALQGRDGGPAPGSAPTWPGSSAKGARVPSKSRATSSGRPPPGPRGPCRALEPWSVVVRGLVTHHGPPGCPRLHARSGRPGRRSTCRRSGPRGAVGRLVADASIRALRGAWRSSASRNERDQRATSLSRTRLRSARMRVERSRRGISMARTMASFMPPMSCGLMMHRLLSSSAAPANSHRIEHAVVVEAASRRTPWRRGSCRRAGR